MAKKLFCNKCGRAFRKLDDLNGFHYEGRFPFGSKYDTSEFEIDLCLNCIDEFVDSCEITPIPEDTGWMDESK